MGCSVASEKLRFQSYDDEIRDILSQYAARIDSVRTFEDLSVVQLENDLSSVCYTPLLLDKNYDCWRLLLHFQATQELDQMRARCESAEASCKSLTEKYQSLLEGYDEALVSSPLRRLNVTTVCLSFKTKVQKCELAFVAGQTRSR